MPLFSDILISSPNIKQLFCDAINSDHLKAQKILLASKKAEAFQTEDKLSTTVVDTLLETASLISKLKRR
jgi:hypothetical protein